MNLVNILNNGLSMRNNLQTSSEKVHLDEQEEHIKNHNLVYMFTDDEFLQFNNGKFILTKFFITSSFNLMF